MTGFSRRVAAAALALGIMFVGYTTWTRTDKYQAAFVFFCFANAGAVRLRACWPGRDAARGEGVE